MKRRIICFVMAMLMMLSVSGTVFAANAEGNNGSADMENLQSITVGTGTPFDDDPSEDPSMSLELTFAKMQLELAEIAKQQAMDRMNQVGKIQDEQKQILGFLNTARQCKEDAVTSGKATEMPADMAAYMNTNNLSYNAVSRDPSLILGSAEWDTAIASLENRIDELNEVLQQQMTSIQDSMGQYNSYMQGANTQMTDANQVFAGLSRGQSMYGDSEVGLAVTGLVVGLILGFTIALAVQKLRRKKETV